MQIEVNKKVNSMPWCDCDVIPSALGNFTIACSEDLTYYHTIELTFIDVLHVHCRYDFRVDTTKGLFTTGDQESLPVWLDKSAQDEGYKQFVIKDEDGQIHTILARELQVSYDNVLRYFRDNLVAGQRIASWVRSEES